MEEEELDIWEKFAQYENTEDLNGTIEGVETPSSHKFQHSVIEPTRVSRRNFNFKTSVQKSDEDKEQNPFRRWWNDAKRKFGN